MWKPAVPTPPSKLKGQFGIMEHLLMAVLILMVVVAALFFFIGFESTKSKGASFKEDIHKILLASSLVAKASFLTKEEFIFDDSKLVTFTGPYDKEGCEQIKKLVGDACVTIDKIILGEEKNDCDPLNFGQEKGCNSWTFCREICFSIQSKKNRGLSIPVNIFRSIENRVDLGLMTVRVPT